MGNGGRRCGGSNCKYGRGRNDPSSNPGVCMTNRARRATSVTVSDGASLVRAAGDAKRAWWHDAPVVMAANWHERFCCWALGG
eukprot:scaffold25717_cov31-Tisochrysis_lutea.AAC.1